MRVLLGGGAYTARSIIASAQRQVNLFTEPGRPGSITDLQGNAVGVAEAGGIRGGLAALYPTPGLRVLANPPTPGPGRGLYWANSGTLFYCCGATLYKVAPDWSMTALGTIAPGTTPVSMADNGLVMVLVDGSVAGYQVDLTTLVFSQIGAPSNAPPSPSVYGFYGADRVVALDGYLILNQPKTRNFYATYSGLVQFDSLYIAAKNGYSDNLVGVVASQRLLWMIGERTTEVWADVGAADFPFAIVPGPFINHGCCAKYSIAQAQESVFWLSQDQSGKNIAVRTNGYAAQRISTHAIETAWSTYPTTSDARGSCFQQNGHDFYQLDFPTADKSWRYDSASSVWHEAVWSDSNGNEHRHRAGCMAFAYGLNVCADWQTGQLYALDPTVFTDAGAPIVHIRGFPHMVSDGNRVFYHALIADLAAGNALGTYDGPPDTSPQLLLRWSDDRGRTWGNRLSASMGAMGDYLTSVQFQRLGMARDRVFELSWDAPVDTALQGAWLTLESADT